MFKFEPTRSIPKQLSFETVFASECHLVQDDAEIIAVVQEGLRIGIRAGIGGDGVRVRVAVLREQNSPEHNLGTSDGAEMKLTLKHW